MSKEGIKKSLKMSPCHQGLSRAPDSQCSNCNSPKSDPPSVLPADLAAAHLLQVALHTALPVLHHIWLELVPYWAKRTFHPQGAGQSVFLKGENLLQSPSGWTPEPTFLPWQGKGC